MILIRSSIKSLRDNSLNADICGWIQYNNDYRKDVL